MTAVNEIKSKILELLEKQRSVSFVDISEIDGFSGGDRFIETPDLKKFNIVMWEGATNDGRKAFNELMSQGILKLDSCSPSIYMDAGSAPNLNVAVRKRFAVARKWIPVLISRNR